MSQEEPRDLSALDSLFSRYGQGGTSRGLSEARKKQIYAGTNNLQEDPELSNPTHKTLKAILDYEETIPDQEVDEFVTKIRDTRLLDDYPDDDLELSDTTAAPVYNPFPLDEDEPSSTIMADPLSGEILVTDLSKQEKTKPEEEPEEDPTASDECDVDDEEPEDLTAEFEKEEESVSSDRHGDGDAKNSEESNEDLIPRIDDDVDKGQSVTMEDVAEEEEEKEEEEGEDKEDDDEKVEQNKDEIDSSADIVKDTDLDSRTSRVKINTESSEGTQDKSEDVTATDGKASPSEANASNRSEKSPQKKKENVPDFETFLAELGVDPKETLDVEAQKSRARLSRVGPLAQRRPMTKRFSGGDEDRSKWMFVDSTTPKPQRSSIDEEEEEEEEENVPLKAPAPQPASKPGPKKPVIGIGLGPMVLPGLGAALGGALGGSKLKKTPTSTPNKTFQKSLEESKVTASKSEPTRTTPLSSLKKTPPPASKPPPTTANKPILNKPKPLAKPRPVSQVTPSKEPSQPAWLKELKSKPKPEVKETKKEEEKLNSDILHPKTNSSETTPKTPSWMANSKTKKLPPIPSSSSTPKQEGDTGSSTPSIPQWKQDLMKKKKAPTPAPSSISKSPVKVQILPKSPSKSPAKPPIARKPDFSKQEEGTDKGSQKPVKQGSVDSDAPKPDKGIELMREEEDKDETDSKKLKLSQSMDSTQDEDKMEVTLEVSSDEKNKDDDQGQDVVEMEQEEKKEEKEEEVKVVKTEEKKVIIIAKEESKKEETKTIKPEAHKAPIVAKNDVTKDTVKEKEDEGKSRAGGIDLGVKKDEEKVEKPVIIIPKPKTDKPKLEKDDSNDVKSVKIVPKSDTKKEEMNEKQKVDEKKVTIVTKADTKKEEPKKMEQKTVTIVSKPEDKKNSSDIPQWKKEARERMQKRKMSGGNIVPLRSPKDTIETNGNNNTPQWKKDLVEKRKMFPKTPSLDNEEKGSVESQNSEKVLKRHTIAADIPTINVPASHKTGTPTWKQELEKKNARLAKHLATKDAGPEIKPPIEGVTQQPVPELS